MRATALAIPPVPPAAPSDEADDADDDTPVRELSSAIPADATWVLGIRGPGSFAWEDSPAFEATTRMATRLREFFRVDLMAAPTLDVFGLPSGEVGVVVPGAAGSAADARVPVVAVGDDLVIGKPGVLAAASDVRRTGAAFRVQHADLLAATSSFWRRGVATLLAVDARLGPLAGRPAVVTFYTDAVDAFVPGTAADRPQLEAAKVVVERVLDVALVSAERAIGGRASLSSQLGLDLVLGLVTPIERRLEFRVDDEGLFATASFDGLIDDAWVALAMLLGWPSFLDDVVLAAPAPAPARLERGKPRR